MAFNPKTGLVYVNSWEIPRIMKYTKFEFVLGAGSTGVETSFRTPPAGEPWGYHMAFNPVSGKTEWKVPVTLRRHARNRWRAAVHRAAEWRVHRARPGQWGDVVEVQDRLRDQFSAHDLHSQRSAIRHGAVRHRGVLNRVMKVADGTPTGGSVWTFALMPE
jgi:hypothetical protein